MAWGGRRPGSGRKANPNRERKVAKPLLAPKREIIVPEEPKITVPAEAKSTVDPKAWAVALTEINKIFQEYARQKAKSHALSPFRFPQFPKAAIPEPALAMDAKGSALKLAMDEYDADWIGGATLAGLPAEGLLFLGYTYLSELAQRPEYRLMSETIADDMTRQWIDFDVTGDEKDQAEQKAKDPKGFLERMADPDQRKKRLQDAGKLDRVKELKDDQERLQIRQRFYEAARGDGFFGRMHLYLDIRTESDWKEVPPDELMQDIGDGRSELSKSKCPKGAFAAIRAVEPVWTYPLNYNATDPLREDWYNPQVWYVMGKQIHGSRMPTFIGRPVPDMLKPAYAFGGLSLSQMAKPYVDIWLQTRQSVADMIKSFSIMVLQTDLSTMLQPGAEGNLIARIALFNMLRDNQGAFIANKNTEDVKNVSAPLGGLHELQAQAQEHMCVPAGTMIATERGQVPIEQVTTRDRVLTRSGLAPIKWVGVTDHRETLIEIEAGNSVLRTTEEHPIWSESTGEFVSAQNVSLSHRLLALGSGESMVNRLHGVGAGGGKPKPDITVIRRLEGFCIDAFGKRIAAPFQKVTTFITEMMTAAITGGTISNCLPALSTWSGTVESEPSSRKNSGRNAASAPNHFERRAVRQSFAPEHARPGRTNSETDGCRSASMTSAASAAASHSRPDRMLDSARQYACSVPVTRVCAIKVPHQPVYDIEVDGAHEFFASGILVHNSSVSRIPLVKFTGISPTGLNATSEFEIEVYDDTIGAFQMRLFDVPLRKVLSFEMLSLWGEVDPEITHTFNPLRQLTEAEKGQKQKDDADRDQKYVDMGAIAAGEVRKRLIEDRDLPYTGLDPDDVPELKQEEEQGLEPQGGRPQPLAEGEASNDNEPKEGAEDDDLSDLEDE